MKRFFSLIIGIMLLAPPAFAQVGLGMRACNNHWDNQWILSPSPEVTYQAKWFLLSMDGTLGYFHPSTSPGSTVFISRASMIPMLKLQWGPVFLATGYGVSHQFRREDLIGSDNRTHIKEKSRIIGEARALLGLTLPLNNTVSLMLKGGYNYQDANHRYFSVSAGFTFHGTPNLFNRGPHKKTIEIKEAGQIRSAVTQQSPFKKATFIKSDDPITSEFNRSIESALMIKGIETYDWATLRHQLIDHLSQTVEDAEKEVHTLSPIDLTLKGAELLNIGLLVDSQLRYNYQTYGGNIFIQYASLRLIRIRDGKVLWTGHLEGGKRKFPEVKRMMAAALLEQLNRL